ncbi:response regulator transcription factor [Nonomuraea sp. NPDC050556]|uniref:response regulator transcription factor n=1 Tax=Nonomuraea sp. NPDC050556 TaxID=3364369 RepID=UPI0037AEE957
MPEKAATPKGRCSAAVLRAWDSGRSAANTLGKLACLMYRSTSGARTNACPRTVAVPWTPPSTSTVAHLDTALRLYEQAEAGHDAARVRDRLKGMGDRRPRSTPGWDGLTESELRIVRLVAGGATNKQVADRLFLSPHTVGTHLGHAFCKLGIGSRVELTRIVLSQVGRLSGLS